MRPNPDPDVLSQAIAEPSRRALLENLRFGQKTVTQLVEATGLKQPNVSNHLAKMRQQGIVRAERAGRQVYYSLSMPFTDVLLRMHEYAANPSPAGSSPAASNFPDDAAATTSSPAHTDAETLEPRHAEHADHPPGVLPGKGPEDVETARLTAWRETFFRAAMAGDEEQAITVVNSLLTERLSLETIYLEIFARAINHIGELFQQGRTDEAHEHMASAIIERMMARVAHFYTPIARTSYRAALGSVAGNWHVLGLRMLADGLKGLGWETIFLGANVPTASFLSLTQGTRPDLVIVSCAMKEQSAEALHLLTGLNLLRRDDPLAHFQIAVGGHYLLERQEEMRDLPLDFTASDLHQFLEIVKTRFPPPRL